MYLRKANQLGYVLTIQGWTNINGKKSLDGVKGYYNLKPRDLVVNYFENYNLKKI